MLVTRTIHQTRRAIAEHRRGHKTVGFVPTMGALHAGHRALMDAARGRCDLVVVSIFVNPTQFAPSEDYQQYPRTLNADLTMCRQAGVDLVFTPAEREVYPPGAATSVRVPGLTDGLCGAHRPGHFDGVTTVVAKLFNIVAPDCAFFGEKDYQQLKVIERMVRDLNMPVDIVACPTVREADGLAMSSRNGYLGAQQRRQAAVLYAAMQHALRAAAEGERNAATLIERIRHAIHAAGPAEIDYVSVVDPETLQDVTTVRQEARICLAVRIGPCRLIDNVAIPAASAPSTRGDAPARG